MDIHDEMLARLRNRKPGFSLDRLFYIDPAYYQLDLEHVWYRDWLFVGHDCEIPAPGNYFTVEVGAYSVIVVRGDDGQIRALHNSCRHRGSRVCLEHKGAAAKLVCPYHQWTYDLDGSLLFARQMGDDFDTSAFGLRSVPCEAAGGYIFISLARDPMDFTPFRAMMEPFFLPHRLREAKVAFDDA